MRRSLHGVAAVLAAFLSMSGVAPGIQLRFDVDGRRQIFGLPHDEIPPAYGVRMVDAGGYLEPRVSWSGVQVAPSVATIRVRTGPDAVDGMTPVGDYAVFATTGTFGRLEAVDAAGTVIVTCSVPVAGARCSLA